MFVTIINDCRDADEMGRQTTRASVLFPGSNINFLGVNNFNEIEAAGLLVDVIDAGTGDKGVIMVNAAPRHGTGKKYENGKRRAFRQGSGNRRIYKESGDFFRQAGRDRPLRKKGGEET